MATRSRFFLHPEAAKRARKKLSMRTVHPFSELQDERVRWKISSPPRNDYERLQRFEPVEFGLEFLSDKLEDLFVVDSLNTLRFFNGWVGDLYVKIDAFGAPTNLIKRG